MIAAVQQRDKLDVAADVLTRAVAAGQVDAAVLYVRHRQERVRQVLRDGPIGG